MSPRVAILLPVYNREAMLPATIAAIDAQTYRDFAIIAVDDASRDSSFGVLTEEARKDPGRWILVKNEKNLGGTANMNRCLAVQRERLPQVDYVMKVDSDDIIAPELLARGVEVLDQHPEAALCHFRTLILRGDRVEDTAGSEFNTKLEQFGWSRHVSHRMTSREALTIFIRYDNFVSSSSGAVVRCKALESLAHPWRDETFLLEDYELWSRLAERGAVQYVADVAVSLRLADNSMLQSEPLMRRQKQARMIAVRAFCRSWRRLGPVTAAKLLPIVLLKWYFACKAPG